MLVFINLLPKLRRRPSSSPVTHIFRVLLRKIVPFLKEVSRKGAKIAKLKTKVGIYPITRGYRCAMY